MNNMDPEAAADFQKYLDKHAISRMETTLSQLRRMLDEAETEYNLAKLDPSNLMSHAQAIQDAVLWRVHNADMSQMMVAAAQATANRKSAD